MQQRKSSNAQGIDVSHHNGNINWAKVAKDRIDFVFIKATQNSIAPMFLEQVKGAKSVGLLIGAYHYLDAKVTTAALAVAAADLFCDAIEEAGGTKVFDLPPMLDYEEFKGITAAQINVVARAFLNRVEARLNVTPGIYTGNSFAEKFEKDLGKYPLWVARYATSAPWDVVAWKQWEFFQYSGDDKGGVRANGTRKVNGINGNVDLNEFNGSKAELMRKYGPKKEEPKVTERDINQVSEWAAKDWAEAKANGYFDGTRPGAPITREQTAIVINRLRTNFLKLIAGNTARISELERKLEVIEKGGELQ
ncbi:glycoside hydrolase family 25 protein [Paenibacillus aceti]|uniref:SLH domain-containing protein n=1 Tax=Paenibacillus aceti TaxID=1820010 RepID=A0ABQ1VRI0_9BACL|nr:glycoside hydrolase family 25 protein [Paenibacillus aceti]GGF87019.1 hypothetical protein GCM10010913_05630 [Paenibacillus aceti]